MKSLNPEIKQYTKKETSTYYELNLDITFPCVEKGGHPPSCLIRRVLSRCLEFGHTVPGG